MKFYKVFYPRTSDTTYAFFNAHSELKNPEYTNTIFETVKNDYDFSLDGFVIEMVKSIPNYNGFDAADCFMRFFKEHIAEVSEDTVTEVLYIYENNDQCTHRSRHESDMKVVKEYLDTRNDSSFSV